MTPNRTNPQGPAPVECAQGKVKVLKADEVSFVVGIIEQKRSPQHHASSRKRVGCCGMRSCRGDVQASLLQCELQSIRKAILMDIQDSGRKSIDAVGGFDGGTDEADAPTGY